MGRNPGAGTSSPEDIDASHVALLTATGSVVIGVFHTLFAGNAGQFVPGTSGPGTRADGLVGELVRLVALETIGAATKTSPLTMRAHAESSRSTRK